MVTKHEIEALAAASMQPLEDAQLNALFDAYNENPAIEDVPHYYRFLYHLGHAHRARRIIELGCKHGIASLHFLIGGNGESLMIDTDPRINWERCDAARGLSVKYYVARQRSTSDQAVALGRRFKPDIVFFDTDHSYDTTREEYERWLPVAARPGLLLFDDVHHEEYGCAKLWKELKTIHGDNAVDLPQLHAGGWGFGAIILPEIERL